ncbi:MAG: Digeranylgeranylglycerophospholipid reductase [Candidatus Methanofastidiosum methylothiophilum]|uniref:Digeranylgeranylglycerophospholipid reductase n=1 Tax=Candidatus Methanofastidiosum methylothiophilum TaxID=1705564 RepID=A0A150II86_9EURY|nr:MAG: Digeranylgeranylglycerophospholipid reductase [Candidatus Methanofastidiosum methylthiophilus]KYC47469.1 MAG: Digeranylgeranylglycerophospholipid reductase [Candidatus Methanofastidiosum methylthiophilus]KYC50028.1 MAG: Digeranylgeranylglycerophospholipid reductase [Candidatus Methanofastidiosum methylthiophilus]
MVGAGPAGLIASQYLVRAGYKVSIIEEHKSIGRPVSCSGLIGRDFFDHFKQFDFEDSIKNRIDGAKIFLGTDSFELKRKGVSFVVDRAIFDQSLSNGLEVSLDEKFQAFERKNETIFVKTNKRRFNTDLLIGADGPSSRVRAQEFEFNLKHYKGYQVRIKSDLDLDNFVEVHIQRPFFTWIIPEGNGIFRIGTVSNNPKETLGRFLEEREIKSEPIEIQAGVIPVGKGNIYSDKVFLLGDAACQVKPLSGGGVYYGALAAEALANSIISGRYSDYPLQCNKLLGKEISRGLIFRRTYENMTDNEIYKVFNFLKSKKQVLDDSGKFDEHSRTILSLIKDHRSISFLPLIFKAYLRTL